MTIPLDDRQKRLAEGVYSLAIGVAVLADPDPRVRDNVISLAGLMVCQSASSYDESLGIPFRSYAVRLIRKVIRNRRKLRLRKVSIISLQDGDAVVADRSFSLGDLGDAKQFSLLLKVTKLNLSERYVIEHWLGGEKLADIAREKGYSRERVRQLNQSAVLKLRKTAGLTTEGKER